MTAHVRVKLPASPVGATNLSLAWSTSRRVQEIARLGAQGLATEVVAEVPGRVMGGRGRAPTVIATWRDNNGAVVAEQVVESLPVAGLPVAGLFPAGLSAAELSVPAQSLTGPGRFVSGVRNSVNSQAYVVSDLVIPEITSARLFQGSSGPTRGIVTGSQRGYTKAPRNSSDAASQQFTGSTTIKFPALQPAQ